MLIRVAWGSGLRNTKRGRCGVQNGWGVIKKLRSVSGGGKSRWLQHFPVANGRVEER